MVIRRLIPAIIVAGSLSLTCSVTSAQNTATDDFFLNNGLTPVPIGHQDVKPGTIIPNNATWILPDDKLEVHPVDPPFHIPETLAVNNKGLNIFAFLFGTSPSALYTKNSSLKFGEIDLSGTAITDNYREDNLMQPNTDTIKRWKEWEAGQRYAIYFVSAVYTTATMNATGIANSDLRIKLGDGGSDACKTVTQAELQALQNGQEVKTDDKGTKPNAPVATTTVTDKLTKAANIPTGGMELCGGNGSIVSMTAKRPVVVAMKICQIYPDDSAGTSYSCRAPDNPKKKFN